MVISALVALFSSLLYLFATRLLWQRFKTDESSEPNFNRKKLLTLALLAAIVHLFSFAGHLFTKDLILFSFGTGLSLISWIAVVALLITNINKATENLGVFIFPIAAITTLLPFAGSTLQPLPFELGSHVLISITAYSIMGLAAAQATLYAIQEKRFQKRQLSIIFKNLPPLQIMEKTLIQLVIIGFIFLSFALISGVFFMEDIFAQHLVHKTFFAILAWLTYGLLIFGHFKFGWRGQKAAYYTIWAYFLLILSYIGTEIILLFFVHGPQ
ncbi:Inner membrane protein YpjD [Hydrogenovibrio crunogenus]|uniref:Inner membrane protein YpjD n=1 Tax=Hydrogenovibrio crunogenus TaxID=39765 RepID=A0A4P7NYX0_9GAMM|nr:cytochrome c biogenesis protein CcsA [Hydrogenovibrio crunogenus]QBZ83020.1 Inner membrane protein YpjD [Hydrogenovibrio crunogenus]